MFNLKAVFMRMLKQIIESNVPSSFYKRTSYSQCGEDLIINFILTNFTNGKKQLRYLDIGAHHPYFLSNTALLYAAGHSGVLVEPNPYYAKLLRRKRQRDKIMQCGISATHGYADFFIMDPPTLSTFSEEEARRYVANGHRIIDTVSVEVKGINEILSEFDYLDFLNLDVEGLDYEIIEAIEWEKFRPFCVCVEVIEYETRQEPKRRQEILNEMLQNDYFLYADTYINAIFVDNRRWQQRWKQI